MINRVVSDVATASVFSAFQELFDSSHFFKVFDPSVQIFEFLGGKVFAFCAKPG